jgi:2'-5' RNA ligase
MTETLRTFIALELPEKMHVGLRQLQSDLKKHRLNFRWVRTENIHLTLKFLGNIQLPDVQNVAEAIVDTAGTQDPLELKISGIGVFPNIRNPRVLWTGLSGNIQSLRSLHMSLEDRLYERGFDREKRRFKGHLTLGRAKGKIDARQIMEAIVACGGVSSDVFLIRHITFFQSQLQQGGPVYSRIMTAPLAENTKP